jgi:hypothetical protein
VDDFCYASASAQRLAAVRVLVGAFAVLYLLGTAPSFLRVSGFAPQDFDPVGPLFWLEQPVPSAVVFVAFAAAVVAGVGFTLGVGYAVSGPVFALLLLLLTTYRSSWGMKFHTENLLTLHVLLLAVAPAADVWRWSGRTPTDNGKTAGLEGGRYGWALRAMSVVTVLTYVLAGLAKVRIGGWEWFSGDVLRTQIAYDNVRKIELGSLHSPLGAAAVGVPWLFPVFAWLTLLVELFAPLALLGRRWALGWAALAWSFHLGVLLLMAIGFPYPLSFVAYASLLAPEKVRDWPLVRRALQARLRLSPAWANPVKPPILPE